MTERHLDGLDPHLPIGQRPEPEVLVEPDKEALAAAAGVRLLTAVAKAVSERRVAHVALTGGSMGSAILAAAGAASVIGGDGIDWTQVHVWWGDERYLPAGDPERNDTQNGTALLDTLLAEGRLRPEHVHRVAGPDASSDAEASAAAYGAAIRADGAGLFDIVLLGMGPDAHVASLFPHHPAQRITDAIAVAVHDSPKPPPTRVSLTFECLERSREVWFLVAGADKADAVCRALTPDADRWDVPAAGVRGLVATRWLLDRAAAQDLR
ncbi:MAG TPA: 6-phosphogluconolactonase [Dermatophilaceae bacterium]|nr:6-phosphogluconolactonase [Dermatophilaceae bacterium]